MAGNGEADDAPGWNAITAMFEGLYPGQKPRHYGTLLPAFLGGRDPLQGISAYASGRDQPHWHLVTYGFTDLYEKGDAASDTSGYGFELTLRVARTGDLPPPSWATNLLQNLARYVFKTGNVFEPGHSLDLNGPIVLEESTVITCALFTRDPEAGQTDTPNGTVTFIQVVGATRDEYEAAMAWNTAGVLSLVQAHGPLMVTDLGRASALADPAAQATVEAGLAAESSSVSELFVEVAEVSEAGGVLQLTVGATAVRTILEVLPRRLPFGMGVTVLGREQGIAFQPSEACGARAVEFGAIVELTEAGQAEFAAMLHPVAGEYLLPSIPGLCVTVIRSEIKDGEDKVVQIVG